MAYTGWADLPLDLLDGVIARLPFPSDCAHFAAVCRAWRSAVRDLVSHLPWIVLPYGTVCTAGHGAACSSFQIPGFPDHTTCLGAAHDCWLVLDRTDDVVRRTPYQETWCKDTGEQVVYARPHVKHKHAYMLHNPFSNVTVRLPELKVVIGHVAETFEVRKMLMRSSAPDDVVAVTTNSLNCNIILCRSGKGVFVLPYFRIVDVVFVGDILYGITSGEELLAFHLGEYKDGSPNVIRIELVIKNPLAKYYYKDGWLWPQGAVVDTSDKMLSSNKENEDDLDEEEELYKEQNDNDTEDNGMFIGYDDELADQEVFDGYDDELADQALEDGFNSDEMVSDNEVFDRFAQPYEAKDELHMGRYLVQSRIGELLLVKHQWQTGPYYSSPFTTRNVEVFKADFSAGRWAAASRQAKGEAIFLSRSYSKCTRAQGDIQEGFVYYTAHLDDVFDMTSCTTQDSMFEWPRQCRFEELTWFFPPELVV